MTTFTRLFLRLPESTCGF